MSRTGSILLFSLLAFLQVFPGCARTAMERLDEDPGARARLEALTETELSMISHAVEFLELSDEVWALPDRKYYGQWLKGLEAEQSGDFDAAIRAYREASQIILYEVDNFEVLLPLGRVLMRDGLPGEARRALTEFVGRAHAALAADGPVRYTEESAAEVEETIAVAEWLLGYLVED